MVVVLVVSIVRKVAQSESDEKREKKLATVSVGYFSLEKRRLKTSRERPKWAPYLRLKNSKMTSEYSLLRYRKNPKVEPNWRTRGDTLKFFIHSVANHQKN